MSLRNDPDMRQWGLILAAAGLLAITMGGRQSLGLFVSPINTTTGLGITTISFAMAVAQFVWGAIQPVAGAVADRYGPGRALAAGVIVMALGAAMTPFMDSGVGMVFTIGLLMAAGSGAGSFSVLIGAASQRLSPRRRGIAAGVINAGGSFGQFVFAPLMQKLISVFGWFGAMYSLALITLTALPLARLLRGRPAPASATPAADAPPVIERGMRETVRDALRDRSYLLLHAGFFTCGFHIAFLVTHLPGEVTCAACRRRWRAGRWRSSGWPMWPAAFTPAGLCSATAASMCCSGCTLRGRCWWRST